MGRRDLAGAGALTLRFHVVGPGLRHLRAVAVDTILRAIGLLDVRVGFLKT